MYSFQPHRKVKCIMYSFESQRKAMPQASWGVWREVARLASRPCRRRRPSSPRWGGVSGWFSSGGPRVRFLTRCDGEVSEPLVGRQGSRVSMRVATGSASLLSSHGRGTWPRDVLKKVSRGLSRVEAGNSGFPRLVQVTTGGFSWWLWEVRETILSGKHWDWSLQRVGVKYFTLILVRKQSF